MENDPTLEKNKRYSAIASKYTDAIINTALKERHSAKGIFSEEIVKKYARKEPKEQVGMER